MLALEMSLNGLVVNREKCLVRALAALDPWLLADASDPLIGARGRVACGLLLLIGPEPGEDILPPAEELAEEPDPIRRQAVLCGRGRWRRDIQRRGFADGQLPCPQRLHTGARLAGLPLQLRECGFRAGQLILRSIRVGVSHRSLVPLLWTRSLWASETMWMARAACDHVRIRAILSQEPGKYWADLLRPPARRLNPGESPDWR
ncbi:MAG: hypothetical protein A2Z31_01435 [candidate division NC10 bacterium RBG_16_65_8]|nr:MAG: hypothetical protein A2Z31_01435 [candidate division NC10 bacterium RBG_16_65_8]